MLDRPIAYWKGALDGASTVLALPADHPRPPRLSFRGATEAFALPATLSHRLRSLGRNEQATLFMVLEAGFAALLHRYTGQADILVGTSISGRTQTETERQIGASSIPSFCARSSKRGRPFAPCCARCASAPSAPPSMPIFAFQRLVATLAPGRDLSRSPLFQVMFILHNPDGVSKVSNVFDRRELETGTSKFDLTLCMSETDGGLEGLMEYSSDLFERKTHPATVPSLRDPPGCDRRRSRPAHFQAVDALDPIAINFW